MWRRTTPIVVISLVLAVGKQTCGDGSDSAKLLISDPHWIRFDVSLGRLMATSVRTKQDPQRVQRQLPSGDIESLAVSLDRGLVSLSYLWQADSWQFAVRVVRRDEVEIRWTRVGAFEQTTSYTQRTGEDLALSVSESGRPVQEYRAKSLWHLAIEHPEVCEKHMVRMLRWVRPNWPLLTEASEVRSYLLAASPRGETISLAEVELLVAQLAEDDFRARQRADRALRLHGQRVLCFLDELDPRAFDTEQRLRINEIRRTITTVTDDTPRRVASWLVNDKRIWLALLDDGDPACQRIACEHLSRVVGRDVALERGTDVLERAEQIAMLRAQLLRR